MKTILIAAAMTLGECSPTFTLEGWTVHLQCRQRAVARSRRALRRVLGTIELHGMSGVELITEFERWPTGESANVMGTRLRRRGRFAAALAARQMTSCKARRVAFSSTRDQCLERRRQQHTERSRPCSRPSCGPDLIRSLLRDTWNLWSRRDRGAQRREGSTVSAGERIWITACDAEKGGSCVRAIREQFSP